MRSTLYTLLVLSLLTSCQEDQRVIEKIQFNTDYKLTSEIEHKVATDTVPWKYQFSASDYASKGDYKNALIHWELAMGSSNKSYTTSQVDSINTKYSKVPAPEYIVEQAKNNQVIIINEAHHNSFHRVFTKSLLKELYEVGYRNLGLEALENGELTDASLNEHQYPIQKSGHYLRDPQFGELVRTALEIGYTVFPYEQTTHSNGKPREIEQARNIQQEIEKRPQEKFLIHCGFDHALEGTHNSWEKAMAGRLTEYTGINPLTINQVVYSERSKPEFAHPLLKALNIKESSVILDNDNKPARYVRGDAWTDIAVFHPTTEYINERPGWLFEYGNNNVSVTLEDIDITFPVMVLAYKKGEDIELAVPVDITEVAEKNQQGHLGLRDGDYRIVVTNGKESIAFEQRVN